MPDHIFSSLKYLATCVRRAAKGFKGKIDQGPQSLLITGLTKGNYVSVRSDLIEKVVDHIDHAAIICVDQKNIAIITDPAIASISRWQAIAPRVVYPIARSVES
jgi:hypothetical protein